MSNSLEVNYDQYFQVLEPGEIVRGVIAALSTSKKHALQGLLIEIPGKSTGFLPAEEISEDFSIGDEIEAAVQEVEGEDGLTLLSLRELRLSRAWQQVAQAKADQRRLKVQVLSVAPKGVGLLVDLFGLEAFIPRSQSGLKDIPRLVGREVTVVVKDYARERQSIVLSRNIVLQEEEAKRALAEEQAPHQAELFDQLTVGETLTGEITDEAHFGYFIDLGHGLKGVLHKANVTWARKVPQLEVGETHQVKLMHKEGTAEAPKLHLSKKDLEASPWVKAVSNIRFGQNLPVKVIKPRDHGVLVKSIDHNILGLIPKSQLGVVIHTLLRKDKP